MQQAMSSPRACLNHPAEMCSPRLPADWALLGRTGGKVKKDPKVRGQLLAVCPAMQLCMLRDASMVWGAASPQSTGASIIPLHSNS